MLTGISRVLRGLYFLLLSTLFATVFYLCLGALFGYGHPFFLLPLFLIFLLGNAVLGLIVFAMSFLGRPEGEGKDGTTGIVRTMLILVSALVLSAVFPASALIGLYPVSMAMFHLLILFYAGLSLGALSASGAVFLWRGGSSLTGIKRYALPFAVFVSLGISYITLFMFRLLTLG